MSQTIKQKTVRGWLLLFCISLILINPLSTVRTIIYGYSEFSEYFDQFPGLSSLIFFKAIISIGILVFGIYAGIALLAIRPGAVKTAKHYLLVNLVCSMLGIPLALMLPGILVSDFPNIARIAMVEGAAVDALKTSIYITVWFLYLTKSKRVLATYEERHSAKLKSLRCG